MGQLAIKDENLPSIEALAKQLVAGGVVPKGMTWQTLAVVGQRGKEIGIPAIQAMQEIYVIQGKAMLKAELQLQLMIKNIAGFHHEIIKWQEDEVEAVFYANCLKTPAKAALTRAYCDRALWSLEIDKYYDKAEGKYVERKDKEGKVIFKTKDNWIKDPIGMLFNRLISIVGRTRFPQYKDTYFEVQFAPEETAIQAIEDLTGVVIERDEQTIDVEAQGVPVAEVLDYMPEYPKETSFADGKLYEDKPTPSTPTDTEQKFSCSTEGCQGKLTGKQMKFTIDKFGKALCSKCQNTGGK